MSIRRRDLLLTSGVLLLGTSRAIGTGRRAFSRAATDALARKRPCSKRFGKTAPSHDERRRSRRTRLGLAREARRGMPTSH